MLFVVATPIGNLSDISYRAIQSLSSCDYILCEDTRHSKRLLDHYSITKKLLSYHKHNESFRTSQVIEDLRNGLKVALISDAGTPCISDPGQQIVVACYQENITVVPIPGPCAAVSALSASPLPTDRFQFVGFLPRGASDLKAALAEALAYKGTTICYESPQRLTDTLKTLCAICAEAPVAVCRELTKLHEQIRFGSAQVLLEHFLEHQPKGEIVLLIGHYDVPPSQEETELSRQEALKAAAKLLGISKKDLYRLIHQQNQ